MLVVWTVVVSAVVLLCASAALLTAEGRRLDAPLVAARGARHGEASRPSGLRAVPTETAHQGPGRPRTAAGRTAPAQEAA